MTLDPNWISALTALFAVAISVWANWSARASQARASALEAELADMTRAQNALAHQSWSDAYFRDITLWASTVSTAIARAVHLVGSDDEAAKRETLTALSAGADMGRWYFPNIRHDEKGVEREPAYRGERQAVLDWIVLAYDLLSGRKAADDRRAALKTCQRNFVSCIQDVLDPRTRAEAIEQVLRDFSTVATLPKVKRPDA